MLAVFYGTCPAYLTNIVESVGAGRTRSSLRSTSSTDFTLPGLSTEFGHAAWNASSEDLRAVVDPAKFRKVK